jgi:hypothetical protein
VIAKAGDVTESKDVGGGGEVGENVVGDLPPVRLGRS